MTKFETKKVFKNKAFSLVELAIVLTIILILITGIISAGQITQIARVVGARTITSESVVPNITGLIAWYETSVENSLISSQKSDNSQITSWYDISPSSIVNQRNTLTKSASSNTLLREDGINSIPSIEFDGKASSKITLSSFYQGSSPQNTIFIVFRPISDSMPQTLIDSYSSGITTSVSILSNTINLNAGNSVYTSSTNQPSISYNGNYIMAVYFNGSSSQAFVNNSENPAGGATINAGNNQMTGMTVGTDKSGEAGFTGLISEIIVYSRFLKSQERRDVFRYLSEKYKIVVSGI